jgi:hypothetical protein
MCDYLTVRQQQPVPMWVQDIYIILMQSLVIIEKEYPGIEKAV